MVHSVVVLVLCFRVIACDASDWTDLPEMYSFQFGIDALELKDASSTTVIMQSASMNGNWLTRHAQPQKNRNCEWECHIQECSYLHSWEWFVFITKWWLDMPEVTSAYLPYATKSMVDIIVSGGTHFIPLSPIDIGALVYEFYWSPRDGWILFVPHTSHVSQSLFSVNLGIRTS